MVAAGLGISRNGGDWHQAVGELLDRAAAAVSVGARIYSKQKRAAVIKPGCGTCEKRSRQVVGFLSARTSLAAGVSLTPLRTGGSSRTPI